VSAFTPAHRGGSGPPLVLLHGFLDTWRVWELVLPALERRHDVLALTLPGHAGGPPITGEVGEAAVLDLVERALDAARVGLAHVVGNSLGGYVALKLAERGRARSVVALAPAGGWAPGDDSYRELLGFQSDLFELTQAAARHAEAILSTREGRRRATRHIATNYEHIPPELLAHELRGIAAAPQARALLDNAQQATWELDAERIACPVRIVWGTADALLPWPAAAVRHRSEWLPHADWVELDGVGHCPQLDVPLETAQLILGFTAQPRQAGS
jgi:pimeloyl-ACP methyl ester carboxylesterase